MAILFAAPDSTAVSNACGFSISKTALGLLHPATITYEGESKNWLISIPKLRNAFAGKLPMIFDEPSRYLALTTNFGILAQVSCSFLSNSNPRISRAMSSSFMSCNFSWHGSRLKVSCSIKPALFMTKLHRARDGATGCTGISPIMETRPTGRPELIATPFSQFSFASALNASRTDMVSSPVSLSNLATRLWPSK